MECNQESYVNQLERIAVFSDDFRDGIKGHVFESGAPGFANGGLGFEETINQLFE